MDEGQQTLVAMGVGIAVGGLLIVGAFFQDAIIAAVRWSGRQVARVTTPLGRGLRDIAQRAVQAIQRPRAAGRVHVEAPSPERPGASLARPSRPASQGPEAAAPSSTSEATGLLSEREPPAQTDIHEEPRPVDDRFEPGRRRPELRRELVMPASRVLVVASVREFLEGRDGIASFDALVRHLDRQFGAGRGVGLLDGLQRSGTVTLQRDPTRPTEILAMLAGQSRRSGPAE